ncbi:formylglycine-generating enzyme family protein [Sandaracinus amylolyticus]|uniref:formylglycine-generating enzyme family protein n=2 Tax=Sandaracinus TaxID=1055688 RepID=UPI001AF79164|nr:SUMF1/EgtB/PvdO family nonheme iron enzyme [Sandaracinus amylolyticus]QRN75801.1 Hypothetical protein MSR10575_88880 [Sandaracinus sp.]UJR87324.1 FGE-sulfatase domain-containing protein [Sandaracinus amylolyticus]
MPYDLADDDEQATVPNRRLAALRREPFAESVGAALEVDSSSDVIGPPGMVLVTAGARQSWLDVTEVTNVDYAQFVRDGGMPPLHWCDTRPSLQSLWWPVVGISLVEAWQYAEWAGKRLPTRSEWLAAARGPGGAPFPWGGWDPQRCNCPEARFGGVCRVDRFPRSASPIGCLDLVGNVREWVCSEPDDPPVPPGHAWALGGSYRAACVRDGAIASSIVRAHSRLPDLGFRCALDA